MNKRRQDQETVQAVAMASDLRAIVSKIRRKLREARPDGFTGAQLLALSRLEREGPLTLTVLARAEGMRPQSMGVTITALEEAGLVSRSPDPSDGRQSILSLTPASEELIRNSRAARNDWLSTAIRSSLSADEQIELSRALDLLKRVVDA